MNIRMRPLLLVSFLLTAVVATGFYWPVTGQERNQVLVNLIYEILSRSHYSPKVVNDQFSKVVFNEYLEDLDYGKRFLTQADVEILKEYQLKIDDELKSGSTELFDKSVNILIQRHSEAQALVGEILSQPMLYNLEDSYEYDGERRDYAVDESALRDVWSGYLKSRVLSRLHDRLNAQESDNDSAKAEEEVLSFEDLEKKCRDRELEVQNDWFASMSEMRPEDWMGVYMNAITGYFDPHTEYFPPQQQEEFEIQMSGQFEGIGAQLKQEGEYVKIEKIISGSASWRQGELEPGDAILMVAQGEEEAEDVVGMKIRNVVKLIRGKKGTEVRLTVRKLDGSRQIIPIIRDVVELEATFVKSAIIEPKEDGDKKIGYIKLPKFYVDFYNESNRNCADDMRMELEKLKADNVDGIVLDLRNNGGGSLEAVVDIVGLFISKGPVVQVKTSNSKARQLKDDNSEVVYDGPLVVMVNEFSASASEIFAAAIQDYGRGIIVGSNTTFGKGTVQNIYNLDRATREASVKPLGALKLTIQKYYRINGGTTQLKGVHPDLVFPDAYMDIEYGEKQQRHPMAYDEIEPADFDESDQWQDQYQKAAKEIEKRIKKEPVFDSIREHAAYMKTQQDESLIPLELEAFRAREMKREKVAKAFKGLYRLPKSKQFEVDFNSTDYKALASEEQDLEDRKKWHKNLGKDLYLFWATQLMDAI
jgi:carboxyl-terminal processing protease